ncbi:MAG: roadblock/LC7 domain-containing protein [Actinobacteria bacterium]|nr:roadblock/LC7 domain-containing protein [Actinomycetota bacterium]
MTAQPNAAGELSWLLDNLLEINDIRQALVLSRDGLVMATAQGMSREESDHLAALAAGLQGLALGAMEYCGASDVRQTIIELDSAFLFVMAAGEGTCLAVVSSQTANVGVIAYEMAMMVRRMGKYLQARPRVSVHESAAG